MRAFLCALIGMTLVVSLAALEPWDSYIQQTRQRASSGDSAIRLELAYYYMMNEQPELAEPLYTQVSEAEPGNHAAWAGLAWSLNAQHKPHKALRIINDQMENYPAYAPYQIQSGYALMQLQRVPEARDSYQNASRLAFADLTNKIVAYQGLAWAYNMLNDKPAALRYQRQGEALSMPGQIRSSRAGFTTRIHYGSTATDKNLWGLQQTASYEAWKLSGNYEDFLISGQSYRKLYGLSLRKQFKPIEIAISAQQLSSKDTYTYPARQAALQLSGWLHPPKLFIRPQLTAFYTEYPEFSVQQLSAQLETHVRDFKLGYTIAYVYKDSDIPLADEDYLVHKFSLSKALPAKLTAGFHSSLGKDNWYSGFDNGIIDSYTRADSYYAASLTFTPLNWLSLYAQYQKGESGRSDLLYTSMSVYY